MWRPTTYVKKCLSDEIFFTGMWGCPWGKVLRVIVVDLKNIGVEFVDKRIDGVCFTVLHEECLVSVEIFTVFDEACAPFLSECCIRRENETRL